MNTVYTKWLGVILAFTELVGCGGGGPIPPPIVIPPSSTSVSITNNPLSVTVTAGATATFTVAASGNPAPTVQWQASADGGATFTNIAGATNATLSFAATAGQNGTQYRAVFTNSSSTATTTAATLTVLSPPAVTTNPANVTVSVGSTATFTATASGNPAPTAQWQVSSDGGATFSSIAGATSVSLAFAATSGQNANQYRAVFTNATGSATTTAATLTVNSAPTITLNPVNISVATSATATFTAAATGNPSPITQWQVSPDGGATFTNIAGATSATLSFTAAFAQNNYLYRAVFTNSVGAAITTAATLTVTGGGKHWGAAQQLENISGTGVFPLEAVDANGNIVAIWSKTGAQYRTVWAARYDATTGAWGSAQPISSATDSAQQGQLTLAMAPNGNAIAVWGQTAGAVNATGISGIWTSRLDAVSQTWSAPQLIGGDANPGAVVGIARMALYPQVAIDANGNAFAIWTQNNGLSSAVVNVWAARYTAGGSWSSASAITADNIVSSGNQQIGFDSAGNAIVTYTINTVVNLSSDILIKSLRYNKVAATWSAEQLIAPDTTFSVTEPRLAVSANGDAVAVWSQSDGIQTNAVANHYDAAMAQWSTAQIIDTNIAGGTAQPTVAIDTNGNAWAIWSRLGTAQGMYIWVNRLTAGGTWGTAQNIASINNMSARYPAVAFDATGKAMATWAQTMPLVTNGPNYSIIVASYNSGAGWNSTQVLETQPGDSSFSQVLFDASGNATAVWHKTDTAGINTTIWSNRFQ